MGGYKTKQDYITASSQLVNTGADFSLFNHQITTPEAKMLSLQKANNAMAAKSLENQGHFAQAARVMHGEMQDTRRDMNQGFSNVVQSTDRINASVNGGFNRVDNTLHTGFNRMEQGLYNVSYNVKKSGEMVSERVDILNHTTATGFNKVVYGVNEVNENIKIGFNTVDNTLHKIDDSVQEVNESVKEVGRDVQEVNKSINRGFNTIDNTLNAGFTTLEQGLEDVSYNVQKSGEMVSERIDILTYTTEAGFNKVSNNVQQVNESVKEVSRDVQQVDRTLNRGFINVCKGLSAVDHHLVEGFTETIDSIKNQTSILDNRLADVGNAMINNMNIQHQLDRDTLVQVGRHIVDVFKQEGEATRETIVKAANATIETLENQGILNRQEIQNMGEFIGKNIVNLEQAMTMTMKAHSELMGRKMDDISDKLTKPGEIQAREHTRSALNFFRDELYDDALRALELANNSYYGYFPALYLKGVINMILENFDIARKSLLAALSQAGAVDSEKKIYEKTLALLMLGRIDILEEKWSEADETFGRLGNMNPDFVIAWIEQAYALFRNDKRGSIDDRSAKILRGLDNLKMKSPLGWYGFALQLVTDFPKEAVKALKRGMAIHKQILEYNKIDIDKRYMSLAVFKILNELYPGQIPYLYAAVLEFAPELRWIVENE